MLSGKTSGKIPPRRGSAPGFGKLKPSTEPPGRKFYPGDVFVPTACSQRNWNEGAPQPERLRSDLEKLAHPDPCRRETGTREINQHVSSLSERKRVIEAVVPLLSDSRTAQGAARCLRILRATDAIPLIREAMENEGNERIRSGLRSNLEKLMSFPPQPTEPAKFLGAIDLRKAFSDVNEALEKEPGELGKARISAYLDRLKLLELE
jgi:hypothetical protein